MRRGRRNFPVLRRLKIGGIALCAILALAYSHANADNSAFFGDGYTVFSLENTQVQLVSENIKIIEARFLPDLIPPELKQKGPVMNPETFLVNAELIFKNFGDDTSIQKGFPFQGEEYDEMGEPSGYPRDLRTWIDGKEIKTEIKKGIKNPSMPEIHDFERVYVFKVHFKKGHTLKIRHLYSVGGWFDSIGDWSFRYILKTGALWKGVIENVTIFYITKTGQSYCVTPEEFTSEIEGDKVILKWLYKNVEPKEDIIISNIPRGIPALSGSTRIRMNTGTQIEVTTEDFLLSSKACRLKDINDCGLRYFRNLIFDKYGYPFKTPWIKAQFYYPGSPYKEDQMFFMEKRLSLF